MKQIALLFTIIIVQKFTSAQQNVGIGTTMPHSSAILDISSTSKGLLIPRMTTTERTTIQSPANGLMVYDTQTNSIWYYNVNAWTNISSNGALSFPYSATVNTNNSAFKITNAGFAAGIEGSSSADYGIGLRGTSTGVGGWGINASVIRKDAVAIYAYSDSGTVLTGSNHASNNTNTMLDFVNNGVGKMASFQTSNPGNASPSLQIASNGIGGGILMYLTNPSSGGAGIEINQEGVGRGI